MLVTPGSERVKVLIQLTLDCMTRFMIVAFGLVTSFYSIIF